MTQGRLWKSSGWGNGDKGARDGFAGRATLVLLVRKYADTLERDALARGRA
jgi:hypothetical protein